MSTVLLGGAHGQDAERLAALDKRLDLRPGHLS
jgi:hypothetical protein